VWTAWARDLRGSLGSATLQGSPHSGVKPEVGPNYIELDDELDQARALHGR